MSPVILVCSPGTSWYRVLLRHLAINFKKLGDR